MKFRLQCILFLSSPFTYYLFVQLLREIDFLRYKMWELYVSIVITLNCKQAVLFESLTRNLYAKAKY